MSLYSLIKKLYHSKKKDRFDRIISILGDASRSDRILESVLSGDSHLSNAMSHLYGKFPDKKTYGLNRLDLDESHNMALDYLSEKLGLEDFSGYESLYTGKDSIPKKDFNEMKKNQKGSIILGAVSSGVMLAIPAIAYINLGKDVLKVALPIGGGASALFGGLCAYSAVKEGPEYNNRKTREKALSELSLRTSEFDLIVSEALENSVKKSQVDDGALSGSDVSSRLPAARKKYFSGFNSKEATRSSRLITDASSFEKYFKN